jgi:predicted exporter
LTEPGAADAQLRRAWRVPAWVWLGIVLALGVHQLAFWRAPKLDSDVMALLPAEQRDPLVAVAGERAADAVTRQVVVLLAAADWDATRRAADAFDHALADPESGLVRAHDDAQGTSALSFYAPYRAALLTDAQRKELADATDTALSERALAGLYGPGVGGGTGDWRDDPLGLAVGWWSARAGRLDLRDGYAAVDDGARTWAILRFDVASSAFRLDGQAHVQTALDAAFAAATKSAPDLKQLRAGVPLHAEAAAVQASHEMNTIGWGSLAAVVLLMWLAFRGFRPLGLVAVSLAIGWAAGVSATALVFGSVHLLTLVFGASLVGVAEDYGIHYFACRQTGDSGPFALMRHLLPGLFLAWVTSALAYLALGAAPFPALRQMAVFSTAGLVAAFATVACWFPWLDQQAHAPSRFGRAIADSLAAWPRLRARSTASLVAAIVLFALAIAGLPKLQVRDDLRSLQNSPPALVAQQGEVGRLLGLPSPAQFFLVRGDSAEQVLEREEALTARLDALVADGKLTGYGATSQWVPSATRQHADAKLVADAEARALTGVAVVTGEALERDTTPAPTLTVDAWLASPASEPFRARWLGSTAGEFASVVQLEGVGPASDLAMFATQATDLPGVRWVDRTGELSALLGVYRINMGWLLLAGFVAVGLALAVRYGRRAWRALLPTLLATGLTLGAMAWLGEPFQLFTVLALLLLLGMGVDYGIFLLEHADDGASWLAVCLGAASTVLAFGLLALSATPALHAFGLTLLLGIGSVWVLSPLFRPARARAPTADSAPPAPTVLARQE